MQIPDLSYDDAKDDRINRQAAINFGDFDLTISAVTISGSNKRLNQDAFGFNKDNHRLLALILDGAVSREASHISRRNFEKSDPVSAKAMLSQLNRSLQEVDLRGGASTATIVEFDQSDSSLDIAHVSDSWAMVEFRDGSTQLLTKDQHEVFDHEALDVLFKVAEHKQIQPSEARHDPEVLEAMKKMFETHRNAPNGKGEGILNGSKYMDQYIQSLLNKIKLSDISSILLGTDGAVFPYEDNSDPEYRRRFFKLVKENGVEKVVDLILKDEEVKPPTANHPRWSLHDDKTLVEIIISPKKF